MEQFLPATFVRTKCGPKSLPLTRKCKLITDQRKTVLVVDDEASAREVISMALTAWGYGVLIAEDGEEALSITKTEKPPVVLSDIIMPEMNGLGLLRQIKKWNPDTAVILFTAHPSIADVVSAMKEGAEDVLTKPINFKRLRHDLEGLFGEIKAPQERTH